MKKQNIRKFENAWITPPSKEGHCCDCDGCCNLENGCPELLPKYCKICNKLSTIGYLMDYPNRPHKDNHIKSGAFWVCDEHNHNTELEKILRKGLDVKELDMGVHGYVMLWMPSDELRDKLTK